MPIIRNTNLVDPNIGFGDPNNLNQQVGRVSAFELSGISKYKPRPLGDFRTDFTYLKFGKDRPENANSGQPYITFPIPLPKLSPMNPSKVGGVLTGVPPSISTYYISNRSNSDFPIRGGGSTFDPAVSNSTLSGQIDRQRIATFLSDVKGKVFANRQQGLQLSNPAMETSVGFQGVGSLGSIFRTALSGVPIALENTRTYSLSNTLRQVGVAGSGYHLVRHGNSPFSLSGNYADTVGRQSTMNANTAQSVNRLLVLQSLKLAQNSAFVNVSGAINSINTINQLGLSLNKFAIQNYQGGPNSAYGIGNTFVKRATDTTDAAYLTKKKVPSAFVMTYDQIAEQKTSIIAGGGNSNNIQEFRSTSGLNKLDDRETNYELIRSKNGGASVANSLNFNAAVPATGDPWGTNSRPDMIKFGFECIDNDKPGSSDFLQFRAYLSNGITDNNQASLSAFKYLGRGEDFYSYQGFSRTISFGFKLPIESKNSLVNSYKKLNLLMSQVYPDYSSTTYIMRAPLVRVTIGDYIYRVPGFLESVNITIDQETPWQAGKLTQFLIEEGGAKDDDVSKLELPQIIGVEISFKPIMDRLPRKNTINRDTSPIILQNYTG